MNRKPLPIALTGALLTLAACSSSASSTSAAAPKASVPVTKASASPSCKLTTTFDYIERDDDPGASVMASEIGNTDYASCTSTLASFASEAGQAPGECTTIALASSNPGYDVNAVPAPPLKDVIMSAGPGC